MALDENVLEIVARIEAKTAEFNDRIDKALVKVEGFGRKGQAAIRPFDGALKALAQSAEKVGRQAWQSVQTATRSLIAWGERGALASVAIATAGVKMAADFRSNMRTLEIQMRANGHDVQAWSGQYEKAAKRLIATYGQSVPDAFETLRQAVDLGLDPTAMNQFADVAGQLGVAMGESAASGASLLASAMHAFQIPASNVRTTADQLLTSMMQIGTRSPEMQAAIERIGPKFQATGGTMEDMLATLGALDEAGIPLERAFRGVSSILDSIIDPSEQAKEALATLGLQFDADTIKTKGFRGVVQELAAAYTRTLGQQLPNMSKEAKDYQKNMGEAMRQAEMNQRAVLDNERKMRALRQTEGRIEAAAHQGGRKGTLSKSEAAREKDIQRELAGLQERRADLQNRALESQAKEVDLLSNAPPELKKQAELMKDIFGSMEAFANVQALLINNGEAFSGSLAGIQGSTGAVLDAFEAKAQGLGFRLKTLWGELTNVFRGKGSLGDAMLDAVIKLEQHFRPAVEKLIAWLSSDATKKKIGEFGEKLAAGVDKLIANLPQIEVKVMAIGKAIKDTLTPIIKFLKDHPKVLEALLIGGVANKLTGGAVGALAGTVAGAGLGLGAKALWGAGKGLWGLGGSLLGKVFGSGAGAAGKGAAGTVAKTAAKGGELLVEQFGTGEAAATGAKVAGKGFMARLLGKIGLGAVGATAAAAGTGAMVTQAGLAAGQWIDKTTGVGRWLQNSIGRFGERNAAADRPLTAEDVARSRAARGLGPGAAPWLPADLSAAFPRLPTVAPSSTNVTNQGARTMSQSNTINATIRNESDIQDLARMLTRQFLQFNPA